MQTEPTDTRGELAHGHFGAQLAPLMSQLYAVIMQHDLYSVQLRGLLSLSMHERLCVFHLLLDGPSSMTDLSKRLNLSGGAITGIAERLGKMGYVERIRDDQDKRRYQLVPTARLTARFAELTRPLMDMVGSFESRAESRDLEVVMHFLDYMRRAYDRAAEALDVSVAAQVLPAG